MESLYIKATNESPEVIFDPAKHQFVITGQSILADPQHFYDQVLEWLDKYSERPPKTLHVTFGLNYYNLASAKRFMLMVSMFSKMKVNGCKVDIEWRFVEEDDFMKEFGQDLSDHFQLPLTLVPSENPSPGTRLAS